MSFKIGRWDVPKDLFDDYVKTRIIADAYLMKKLDTHSHSEYERGMRWQLSVQQLIKIHREICEKLNIPYSEESDDEFYRAFTREVNEQVRLRG